MAGRRQKELEDDDVLSPQHGGAHNVTLQSARRPDDDMLMTRYSPPFGQQLGDTHGHSQMDVRNSAGTPPQDRLARTSFGGPSPSRGRGLPKREPSPLSTSTPVTPSTIGDQRKPSGARREKEDGGRAQGRKLKMKERQLDTIYPTNFTGRIFQ